MTPRRLSAAARSRPPDGPSSRTPADTGTAAAIPAGSGACACTCSPRRTAPPEPAILAPADQKERDVALRLFPIGLRGGETIIANKGYVGRELAATTAEQYGAIILRPKRQDEPGPGPHLAPIRQCIESIFWTLKDRLGLERHNTRTLHGLRARIATKLLALAAGVWLNHYLNRPSRTFADLAH